MSDQGDLNHKGRDDKSEKPGKGEHYKGTWRMVAGVLFVVMALYGFSNSQMSSDDLIGGGFWIVLGVVLAVWGFLLRRKRIVVRSFKFSKRLLEKLSKGLEVRRKRWRENAERRAQEYEEERERRRREKHLATLMDDSPAPSRKRQKRTYVRISYGTPDDPPYWGQASYLYHWTLPEKPEIGDWVVVDAAGEILTGQVVAFGKRSEWSGSYVKKVRGKL